MQIIIAAVIPKIQWQNTKTGTVFLNKLAPPMSFLLLFISNFMYKMQVTYELSSNNNKFQYFDLFYQLTNKYQSSLNGLSQNISIVHVFTWIIKKGEFYTY